MQKSSVAPMGDSVVKELPTEEAPVASDVGSAVKKKVPKRVLHFSDGTLEEYSTDEEDGEEQCRKENAAETQLANINPATLQWIPWFYHQTSFAGYKALAVCDYLGEYLANFFGILSPKYEYEIEQYKKIIAEEEERSRQDLELGGWDKKTTEVVLTEQKKPTEPKV